MAEKDKKPEIRFAGFIDGWEHRKLGELMNVTSVKRIHQSDWTNSGIRFLRARDIVSASKNEEPVDYLYISEEKYNEYSSISGKVNVGDLLVTGVGTIGVPMLITNNKPIYFKDGNIIWFKNESQINGKFLYYSFTGNQIQSFINESAGIGTVGTYTIESGKRTPIALPIDTEQDKIGMFFQKLDNHITLHQRKYDKLVNIKKSMLEKMFPQNGADVPEIRFKGFTDAWEQRELGEVLTERKILQKISDDAPVLAFAAGQGVIDRSERKSNNRDHLTLDPTNKNYLLTEYNDIVYNPSNLKYGAIDRNKYGKGVISPIYVTFTTDEEPSFIELIVKSEKFKLRALQFEEGTVVKRQSVKPENLLTLDVKISPSRNEQKKIGEIFKQLDNLITLHHRELEKLKNIKKACLEKMFV